MENDGIILSFPSLIERNNPATLPDTTKGALGEETSEKVGKILTVPAVHNEVWDDFITKIFGGKYRKISIQGARHDSDKIWTLAQLEDLIENDTAHTEENYKCSKKVLIVEILRGNIAQDDLSLAIKAFNDRDVNIFAQCDKIRRGIDDPDKIELAHLHAYMERYLELFTLLDPSKPSEDFCNYFEKCFRGE